MNEFWTRKCVRSPGLLGWIVLESSPDICDWIYKLTLRLEPDDLIFPSAAFEIYVTAFLRIELLLASQQEYKAHANREAVRIFCWATHTEFKLHNVDHDQR
jgi:hypothetical protein